MYVYTDFSKQRKVHYAFNELLAKIHTFPSCLQKFVNEMWAETPIASPGNKPVTDSVFYGLHSRVCVLISSPLLPGASSYLSVNTTNIVSLKQQLFAYNNAYEQGMLQHPQHTPPPPPNPNMNMQSSRWSSRRKLSYSTHVMGCRAFFLIMFFKLSAAACMRCMYLQQQLYNRPSVNCESLQ